MNDLGWTPPKTEKNEAVPASVSGDDKPQYPSLRFNGEQAAKADLSKCEFGETYELTIRVKATIIGGSSYPGSGNEKDKPAVEFDVLACDEPKEVSEQEEDARGPKVKGPKEAGIYSTWKKRDEEEEE